jgi:hypothetical protein
MYTIQSGRSKPVVRFFLQSCVSRDPQAASCSCRALHWPTDPTKPLDGLGLSASLSAVGIDGAPVKPGRRAVDRIRPPFCTSQKPFRILNCPFDNRESAERKRNWHGWLRHDPGAMDCEDGESAKRHPPFTVVRQESACANAGSLRAPSSSQHYGPNSPTARSRRG